MSTSTLHPLSRVLPTRPLGPMRAPARALGWFSIGLGLAELAMPRRLARIAGMPNAPRLTRAYGLREIGTGIGILTSKDPSPWLWGRVAGDALDVATVGVGLVTQRRPLRTLTSIAMLLGIAYIDMKVAEQAPPKRKLREAVVARLQRPLGIPEAGGGDARRRVEAEQPRRQGADRRRTAGQPGTADDASERAGEVGAALAARGRSFPSRACAGGPHAVPVAGAMPRAGVRLWFATGVDVMPANRGAPDG